MTPEGCGIGRAPDGSFKVTGEPHDLGEWWMREMDGRSVGSAVVRRYDGVGPEGVWWSDYFGPLQLRTWAQVHRDLGDSFLRASRA